MRKRLVSGLFGVPALLVCVIAVAAASPATGQSNGSDGYENSRYKRAEWRFVEHRPGVSTATTFKVDYVNPDDPNAKPPSVQSVVETLAQGAEWDTSVPAQCTAGDAQLIAEGESACPPGSRVGGGYIRIDTGFSEPNRFYDVDVVFFNNENQLIFFNTVRQTGTRVVARAPIEDNKLTSTSPPLPGTPPDGGAIDFVDTRLEEISKKVGGETRGYITTPPTCPSTGTWNNHLRFTFRDGLTQEVDSPSACRRSGGGKPRGRCAAVWQGSGESDRHFGSTGGDRLTGFGASDRLRGRRGDDCLEGDGGADVLRGGAGADRLNGGSGTDLCRGGRGRDRFSNCETVKHR